MSTDAPLSQKAAVLHAPFFPGVKGTEHLPSGNTASLLIDPIKMLFFMLSGVKSQV
jgi:hypothetical protein